jgi:hypothetical protein
LDRKTDFLNQPWAGSFEAYSKRTERHHAAAALGVNRPKTVGEWAVNLANGGSSLVVPADNGPMSGLTRSPSLALQSGFMLCPLGRFTGLLSPALFLLGPALLAFSRFACQPLGG